MAKGQDQFEKFKAATFANGPSIKAAISTEVKPAPSQKPEEAPAQNPLPSPTPEAKPQPVKKDKPAVKLEQVSFFLDKDLKKAVGLLKYELDVQLKDLYEEAIRDLLKKYHKL